VKLEQPAFSQATSTAAEAIAQNLKKEAVAIADEVVLEVRRRLKEDAAALLSADMAKEIKEHYSQEAPHQFSWEPKLERALFFSRWLMAPTYLFLVVVMVGLVLMVGQHTFHFIVGIYNSSIDSVAQLVDILDLMLIGSLLVMVLIGGFENTISRINKEKNAGPSWVGNLEISHLKIKVAASVVLISGVHLLKFFLSLGLKPGPTGALVYTPATSWDYNVLLAILIHLIFIVSVLLLAWVDKILHDAKYDDR
jgi:uncharacterized protein (TIGR00645 family)